MLSCHWYVMSVPPATVEKNVTPYSHTVLLTGFVVMNAGVLTVTVADPLRFAGVVCVHPLASVTLTNVYVVVAAGVTVMLFPLW